MIEEYQKWRQGQRQQAGIIDGPAPMVNEMLEIMRQWQGQKPPPMRNEMLEEYWRHWQWQQAT